MLIHEHNQSRAIERCSHCSLHSEQSEQARNYWEPQWIVPVVVVNAISGGVVAPRHTIRVKDGNVLEIGRVATGPGTALTLDVWIYRQQADSSWFSRL